MRRAKHFLWVGVNLYARVFARPSFASFHQALLTFALHGLGYNNIYRESFTGEDWFIETILKQANIRTCLDVGANVGLYSETLAKNLDCTVHAIEPSAAAFSKLEQVAARFPDKIIPHRLALSDHAGTATLHAKAAGAVTATLDGSVLPQVNVTEEVPVTTVDLLTKQLGAKNFDLIKIDVEGLEREVFRGMEQTIREHPPRFIQFEFNVMQLYRGYTLLTLAELIPGYTFYRLLPRGWIKVDPRKFANNIFMYSNYIAVRND